MSLPELSTNIVLETTISFVAFIIIAGLLTLQILLKINEAYAYPVDLVTSAANY